MGVNAAGSRRQRIGGRAERGGLPALPEAVALHVHLQDVNAVSDPVRQGSGQPLRAEGLGPLVKGQVGGDQDEAQLVGDQQLKPRQLLLKVEQSPLVPGLDPLVYQEGVGDAARQPPLTGGEPLAEGHVRLADTAVADGDGDSKIAHAWAC